MPSHIFMSVPLPPDDSNAPVLPPLPDELPDIRLSDGSVPAPYEAAMSAKIAASKPRVKPPAPKPPTPVRAVAASEPPEGPLPGGYDSSIPFANGLFPDDFSAIYSPVRQKPKHNVAEYRAATDAPTPISTPTELDPLPTEAEIEQASAIFNSGTKTVAQPAASVAPSTEPEVKPTPVVKNDFSGANSVTRYITPTSNPTDPLTKPEGVTDWGSLSAAIGNTPARSGAKKVTADAQQVAAQNKAKTEESMRIVAALTKNRPLMEGWDQRMAEALSLMPSV